MTSASARLLAAALLAVAFLLGILGGIVFDRWVLLPPRLHALHGGGPGRGPDGFAGSRRPGGRFERLLREELDLTEAQRAQVETLLTRQHQRSRAIMDGARPELRAIAEETRTELRAILTPEQWQRVERLENERRERRSRSQKHR